MDTTAAVTNLYRSSGEELNRRFYVMSTNLKRQILVEFISAPDILAGDIEQLLGDQSATLIVAQKIACHRAAITAEQKQDFEDRIDNCLAETIDTIRQSHEEFGDRTSPEFQLAAAKKLGLPIA